MHCVRVILLQPIFVSTCDLICLVLYRLEAAKAVVISVQCCRLHAGGDKCAVAADCMRVVAEQQSERMRLSAENAMIVIIVPREYRLWKVQSRGKHIQKLFIFVFCAVVHSIDTLVGAIKCLVRFAKAAPFFGTNRSMTYRTRHGVLA